LEGEVIDVLHITALRKNPGELPDCSSLRDVIGLRGALRSFLRECAES